MPKSSSKPREIKYVRPWMYQKQLDGMFCEERYGIVEATTKAGKTVSATAWLVEQAFFSEQPHRQFWWVAPVYGQARIAYNRIKHGLTAGAFTKNDTDLTLTLTHNRCVLAFKGSDKPDTLYGEDCYGVVVDEGSRCKEDAWVAVRSTMTQTGGPVRIIGNVKGRHNWFYKLARIAQGGEPGYHYTKITAYDAVEAGVFPQSELEDARRAYAMIGRDDVFRELYLAEASDDGGNPFGLKAIDAQTVPGLSTKPLVVSDSPLVALGVDLAKSRDWTVVIGLDAEGRVCLFDRWQMSWNRTLARLMRLLTAPAAVDSTGVGDPIVEQLQQAKHNLIEGFNFSSKSKQQLMEGLAVAIQNKGVWFPEGPIKSELECFEFETTRTGVRYSAPSGMHDDCVMALALAVHKLSQLQHKSTHPSVFAPISMPRTSPWRNL